MIHIGNRIKEVFENRPKRYTIDWFATELHCKRANIYNIFNRPTIDTELLARISVILQHDFFLDLSYEMRKEDETFQSNRKELYDSIMRSVARTVHQQLKRSNIVGNKATSHVINQYDDAESPFPYPEYKVTIQEAELPEVRPHIHLISSAQGFDIRMDIDDGTLISVKKGSKKTAGDYTDIEMKMKEWLTRPSSTHPDQTNREVARYFYATFNKN